MAEEKNTRTHQVLFAEDGAWERLVEAKEALVRQMRSQLAKPDVQPAYEGLSLDDTDNLLISHCGLNGEFTNGPDCLLGLYRNKILSLSDVMARLFVDYDAPGSSQLSGLKNLQFSDALPLQVARETQREALSRCANEVEQWAAKNPGIEAGMRARISDTLGDYRAALTEVNQFLDVEKERYAKGTAGPKL